MANSHEDSSGYMAQDRAHHVVLTTSVFLAFDTAFVALRFYSRRLKHQELDWDDWVLIPSWILIIGTCIIGYLGVNYGGVGRHIDYVSQYPEKLVFYYKDYLIALPCVYVFSMTVPKFSILGLYLHIFRDKISRFVVYGIMFAITVNCIIVFFLNLFKCSPISYGWKELLGEKIPGESCVNLQPRFVWGSLTNIITDVVMMILPIPMIWKLHTNKRTKFGLVVMFGLGSAGIFASCMRFAAFYKIDVLKDATWDAVDLFLWCLAEPSIYLMAACVLAFGPFLTKSWDLTHYSTFKTWIKKNLSFNRSSGSDIASLSNKRSKESSSGVPTSLDTTTARTQSNDSADTTPEDPDTLPENQVHVSRRFDIQSYAQEDAPHSYRREQEQALGGQWQVTSAYQSTSDPPSGTNNAPDRKF